MEWGSAVTCALGSLRRRGSIGQKARVKQQCGAMLACYMHAKGCGGGAFGSKGSIGSAAWFLELVSTHLHEPNADESARGIKCLHSCQPHIVLVAPGAVDLHGRRPGQAGRGRAGSTLYSVVAAACAVLAWRQPFCCAHAPGCAKAPALAVPTACARTWICSTRPAGQVGMANPGGGPAEPCRCCAGCTWLAVGVAVERRPGLPLSIGPSGAGARCCAACSNTASVSAPPGPAPAPAPTTACAAKAPRPGLPWSGRPSTERRLRWCARLWTRLGPRAPPLSWLCSASVGSRGGGAAEGAAAAGMRAAGAGPPNSLRCGSRVVRDPGRLDFCFSAASFSRMPPRG